MYQRLSDILWKIIKPIAVNIVRKKAYPEDLLKGKGEEIQEQEF